MEILQAFDVSRRPLPLRITERTCEREGMTCSTYTMRNGTAAPVRPALVRVFRRTAGRELHLFKPGMQKPSDTARFYTLSSGEPVPFVNTWRGEWLADFGPHEMLVSSMSCFRTPDGWDGIGFGTFEAFHGLVVFDTAGPEITVEAWLETEEILLEPGESVELETLLRWHDADFDRALEGYIEELTRLHGTAPHPEQRGSAGWSDWEFYRNDKTSFDIMASASALEAACRDGLDIRTVVVDGGWAKNLAEWTETADTIPEGAETLLARIREKGLRSGIWFAPYIVNSACRLVQEHPEWLLRDKDGKILRSSVSNVGAKCTLDFSVPGVMEHLKSLLEMFKSWGVVHLKLDGPVLAHYDRGRFRDPRSTRLKQIRATLKLIREVCPDMVIESEGVYGPAVGIADCHRVTQDEHPFWTDPHWGISVVKLNSLVMLLSSAWDRRCWSNINMIAMRDFATPHLYYLADAKPDSPEGEFLEPLLTENELQVFQTAVAVSGSTVFFSAPQELVAKSPEMMKHLGRMLPVASGLRLTVLDPENDWPSIFRVSGGRDMTAVFNWGETFADFAVPAPEGTVFYDYYHECLLYPEGGELHLKDLPPRSCRLLWHCRRADAPTFAGATSHLLGTGIVFSAGPDGAVLELELRDTAEQSATLFVPEKYAPEVRGTLAPFRGGPEREVKILADDRIPGVLRLVFRAPVCGKLRITLGERE